MERRKVRKDLGLCAHGVGLLLSSHMHQKI